MSDKCKEIKTPTFYIK